MKKKILFALMIGAFVGFTSCSKDEEQSGNEQKEDEVELTEEEKIEIKRLELLEEVSNNSDFITSNKWQYEEFQPSDAMVAASETEDGASALTTIQNGKHAKKFNMVISFTGDKYDANVDINLDDDQVDIYLKEYQDELYPDFADWGFILGKVEVLSAFRRTVASPFAADDLKIDDITDEDTGLVIFNIEKRDLKDLSYEDLVLSQNKLIVGNEDKLFLNEEEGELVVETSSTDYGVSKVVYSLVK